MSQHQFDLAVFGQVTRDVLSTSSFRAKRLGGISYAASTAKQLGLQTCAIGIVANSDLNLADRILKRRGLCAELSGFDGLPITYSIHGADEITDQVVERTGGIPSEKDWNYVHQNLRSAKYVLIYPVSNSNYDLVAERYKADGTIVAIDLQHDIRSYKEILDVFQFVDIIFTNRDAILSLTESRELSESIIRVREHYKGILIVKMGLAGSYAIDSNNQCYHIPAFLSDFQVTVGAGDAFNSGVIASLMSNASLCDAVTHGARVASIVIEKLELDPSKDLANSLTLPRSSVGIRPTEPAPLIYVAGHFHSSPLRFMLEGIAAALEKAGFRTFLPHRDVGVVNSHGVTAETAFKSDLEGLRASSGVVALLDGANRGGTYFELGYADALNIPLIVLSTDNTLGISNMILQSAKHIGSDLRLVLNQCMMLCGNYQA